MLEQIKRFLKDEEGASAVEYALIAGLIAVVLITVITSMNGGFSASFGYISEQLNSVAGGTGG